MQKPGGREREGGLRTEGGVDDCEQTDPALRLQHTGDDAEWLRSHRLSGLSSGREETEPPCLWTDSKTLEEAGEAELRYFQRKRGVLRCQLAEGRLACSFLRMAYIASTLEGSHTQREVPAFCFLVSFLL